LAVDKARKKGWAMTPKRRPRRRRMRLRLSRKTLGVRTPDLNDVGHGSVHLLWRQSRVCCSPEVFKWHSVPLIQQNLKPQEPHTFIRL
jgi:hypothetical protein